MAFKCITVVNCFRDIQYFSFDTEKLLQLMDIADDFTDFFRRILLLCYEN